MSTTALVHTEFFQSRKYPMVIQPQLSGLKLDVWAQSNKALIETWLLEYGALLFRGFNFQGFDGDSIDTFKDFVTITAGSPLSYSERSSPRSLVQDNIYTSTSHPASEEIFLHNEQSYNLQFPMRIFFHCIKAADSGGATTISDTRWVYDHLSTDIIEKFSRQGYIYQRNFGGGLGLDWETAFQTNNKCAVEHYCRQNKIDFTWLDQERLRTRQVRHCIAKHPSTGDKTWFNHATFFHVSTLTSELVKELQSKFTNAELPNQTFYGDGTTIEPIVLDQLRSTYEEAKVSIHWQKGDVLMVDNMRMAHGRASFSGDRNIVAALAKIATWDEVLNK